MACCVGDRVSLTGPSYDRTGDEPTYVNIICRGIPSFCAQWICAKLGGLAMIALAMNGFLRGAPLLSCESLTSSLSAHDFQHPSRISAMPLRRLPTSPSRRDFTPGMRPGFLTMNAISSAGSPPMSKNSRPFSSTNVLKVRWVANRTRWPYSFFSTWPSATKGWTSPLEPTTCITTLSGGGGLNGTPSSSTNGGGGGWLGSSCIWVKFKLI